MKTVTLKNTVHLLIALMILPFVSPANASSVEQSTDNELPNLVTYYSVKEYSNYIPELRNTISITINSLPPEEALFLIAQEADLEIAFDSGIFGDAEKVTLDRNRIRVADALEHVLEGTGYEPVMTSRRKILLKKEEALPD